LAQLVSESLRLHRLTYISIERNEDLSASRALSTEAGIGAQLINENQVVDLVGGIGFLGLAHKGDHRPPKVDHLARNHNAENGD
jgi:hypothetical protein